MEGEGEEDERKKERRGRDERDIHVIGGWLVPLSYSTEDGNFQSRRRSISAGFQIVTLSTC